MDYKGTFSLLCGCIHTFELTLCFGFERILHTFCIQLEEHTTPMKTILIEQSSVYLHVPE